MKTKLIYQLLAGIFSFLTFAYTSVGLFVGFCFIFIVFNPTLHSMFAPLAKGPVLPSMVLLSVSFWILIKIFRIARSLILEYEYYAGFVSESASKLFKISKFLYIGVAISLIQLALSAFASPTFELDHDPASSDFGILDFASDIFGMHIEGVTGIVLALLCQALGNHVLENTSLKTDLEYTV